MKASVIAVGTEITSGQIINKNSSWLANRLEALGIEVALHLAVADDWNEIKWALDQCTLKSDLIFTTGGLGPTTDDFTRNVVAEWSGLPLIFDEPSLVRLREMMARFKRTVAESQKRQCEYPEGSEILNNRAGTASGFSLEAKKKKIWILPGPPREVASIWDDFIEPYLQSHKPHQEDRLHLLRWHCLGKPEAELAELVEEAVQGSLLKTGYRLHAPYVEIKIWCPKSQLQTQSTTIQRVETAIRPWLALREDENLAQQFLDALARRNLSAEILDQGTLGFLDERLSSMIREGSTQVALRIQSEHGENSDFNDFLSHKTSSFRFAISPLRDEKSWSTHMAQNGTLYSESFESAMPPTTFNERNKLMALELSLKKWLQWMNSIKI